jgi:hypothetical protein
MAFKLKRKRGRPSVDVKIRSVDGITPSGYSFVKYDKKSKSLVYKKEM